MEECALGRCGGAARRNATDCEMVRPLDCGMVASRLRSALAESCGRGDTQAEGEVRTISLQESPCKLPELVLVRVQEAPLARAMGPEQFGSGVRGGGALAGSRSSA